MSAPPYMKLYWGDYHRATRHLNRGEHGAYFLLIGALWDANGKLPADDLVLAKYALCTSAEWDRIKGVILPFFKVSRGVLTHKRVSEELSAYRDTVLKRKKAGKSGGTASARNRRENRPANAIPNGTASDRQKPTQSEPEPEKKEVEANASVGSDNPTKADPWAKDADFQAAWSEVTPAMRSRAKSRAKVWPEWQKAKTKAGGGNILLASIRRYLANDPDVHRTSGPGLQRWLADGRWEHWLTDAPTSGALFARDPALRRNNVY